MAPPEKAFQFFSAQLPDQAFTFCKKLTKAELQVRDKVGRTLLHYAMEHNALPIASWLIENEVNPLATDHAGHFPFAIQTTTLLKNKNSDQNLFLQQLTSLWKTIFKQYGLDQFIGLVQPQCIFCQDSQSPPLVSVQITNLAKFNTLVQKKGNSLALILPLVLQSEYVRNIMQKALKEQYAVLAHELIPQVTSDGAKQAHVS